MALTEKISPPKLYKTQGKNQQNIPYICWENMEYVYSKHL